ncbi:hypothetical protein OsJ_29819 [Oryza sativa Japonica Group]|uniref:Uncharacterized protein n=1 Tax=Oryza sativa subsp. japonica TaxID=39947 RepID=A3C038_ORYSJ|nr:hypothetical protein OsJ_29819 [Oryza sativa Japonica Group]
MAALVAKAEVVAGAARGRGSSCTGDGRASASGGGGAACRRRAAERRAGGRRRQGKQQPGRCRSTAFSILLRRQGEQLAAAGEFEDEVDRYWPPSPDKRERGGGREQRSCSSSPSGSLLASCSES